MPIVGENAAPLLVDRCEVTRGEWRRWFARQTTRDPLLDAWIAQWQADLSDDWPATFMNLREARAFAAERGMRLLTAREWLRIACGPRRQPWPWGPSAQVSVANTLELGLGRVVAVGTFEQGRSPLAVFDLLGNVWEWVEQPIASGRGTPAAAWAMGGSYLSWSRRLYELVEEVDPATQRQVQRWSFYQQDLHPDARSSDVGLRCAVAAEEYLARVAPTLERSARERLIAVGRAWGPSAVPLLERMSAEHDAPQALGYLLEGARR